jgi:hypothetical protein
MKRLFPALLGLALLAGCETSSGAPPIGATDVRIDAEHYRTTFRGVSGASPQEIEDRALLHAATLALAQGYDWFRITNRSGGFAAPTTPQFSFGIGGASFGRGSAIGVGGSRTVGGEPTYVADLELVFGKGPKPPDPQVYDARSVTASLGPRLAPPPPPR